MYRTLKYIFLGVPIGVTAVDCLGYVAKVDGVSMQPALNPNGGNSDYVFLSRWYSRSFQYERGDMVILLSPKNPDQKMIKRIIALEGDLVRTLSYKQRYVRVPEGHCWVEGDHTGHSLDSNFFGPVALGLITAKALRIVWPYERWSKIESEIPDQRIPINLKGVSGKASAFSDLDELIEAEDRE